jgi:hypothetical protein
MRSVDKFVTMPELRPALNHFHRVSVLLQPKVAQNPDYAFLCSAFPIATVSKDGFPKHGGYVCNVNFLNFVVGTLLNAVRVTCVPLLTLPSASDSVNPKYVLNLFP